MRVVSCARYGVCDLFFAKSSAQSVQIILSSFPSQYNKNIFFLGRKTFEQSKKF